MNCPYYGASDEGHIHYVQTTYQTEKGNVRRRKKCWNCGKNFNTIEYYVSDKTAKSKSGRKAQYAKKNSEH